MKARRSNALATALILASCGAPPSMPAPAAPAPAPAPATIDAVDAAVGSDSTEPSAPVPASPVDAGVEAGGARIERSGRVWPFHAWTRAEAVHFNDFPQRPRTPLRAYDEAGWSPHVAERRPVDAAAAKQAVDLVTATRGEVVVSKCPFPRHAVVFFDGDAPVASVNVCFECGDILLWPRWEGDTPEARAKLHDKVFPRWRSFFRDRVGFGIEPSGG